MRCKRKYPKECPSLNCTRCKRRGHLSKDCYTKLNRENKPNPSYSMPRRDNSRKGYQQGTEKFRRINGRYEPPWIRIEDGMNKSIMENDK